jgi:hypothetical protein
MDFIRSHKLIVATIAIQIIALPLILFLVKQRQETRTQAAATTTLYFNPASSASTPIQATPGQNIALDLMVDPGANWISLAKIEITYDPNVLAPADANPVVVNAETFPVTLEGPITSTPGKIQMTLAIGGNLDKVIQSVSKILTLNMKVVGNSATTSTIGFGSITELLSAAEQDSASENVIVLNQSTPATIKVTVPASPSPTPPAPTNTPTPSPRPSNTPTPTPLPSATPTPSPRPSNTPTPTPPSPTVEPVASTLFKFVGLKLHGLGRGGDNPNPNSIGTLTPLRLTRPLTVELYNKNGALANTITGNVTYTGKETGVFNGDIVIPSNVAKDVYTVKIRTPYYKGSQLPGLLDLTLNQSEHTANLTGVALVAGDVNQDNSLSSADYEIIMECYSDLLPAKPTCTSVKKLAADISDDGKVDQRDYNLFLRELSVQRGD